MMISILDFIIFIDPILGVVHCFDYTSDGFFELLNSLFDFNSICGEGFVYFILNSFKPLIDFAQHLKL